MRAVTRRLREEINGRIFLRASLVLAPLILLAAWSGDPIWLRAGLITISTFIGMERSGLAPLGVVLHGIAILLGFSALLLALPTPPLFVGGCAVLATGAIALTARGAKLRSLGNFTFIPSLYLACEIGENLQHGMVWGQCLHFLPFATAAIIPTLIMSVVRHIRDNDPARGHGGQFHRVMRQVSLGDPQAWKESVIAVACAVALAATLVEWRHLGNGQWVIWSAASVVTGNAGTARAKLKNRAIGATIGVPAGIGIGQLVPHTVFAFDLTVLAATMTLVAFSRYIVGFGVRCMFIAIAFMIAGLTASVAAERVINVVIGGLIGLAFVLGIHFIAIRRQGSGAAHEAVALDS